MTARQRRAPLHQNGTIQPVSAAENTPEVRHTLCDNAESGQAERPTNLDDHLSRCIECGAVGTERDLDASDGLCPDCFENQVTSDHLVDDDLARSFGL